MPPLAKGGVHLYLVCISFNLRGFYGGEGGIRTPDSLSTMPDFESGAFNRALPPLRDPAVDRLWEHYRIFINDAARCAD